MATDGAFWTAVAALAASASALIAAFYTWLTVRLVRSQAEPNIIVYACDDDSRPTIIRIVIENIGRGLATDVHSSASRPIPWHAWRSTAAQSNPVESMTDGPLINGISALAPGDSRKLTWGQYHGLKKALGDQPIIVTCTYRYGSRKMPQVVTKLDVDSFALTDAVESEGLRAIKELDRIAAALERGWQAPNVASDK